jgi:hypothetical protein
MNTRTFCKPTAEVFNVKVGGTCKLPVCLKRMECNTRHRMNRQNKVSTAMGCRLDTHDLAFRDRDFFYARSLSRPALTICPLSHKPISSDYREFSRSLSLSLQVQRPGMILNTHFYSSFNVQLSPIIVNTE